MKKMFGDYLSIIDHPLVQHKLTIMRRKETSHAKFRSLLKELSMLLAYEVTRDIVTSFEEIETPLCTMKSQVVDGKKIAIVSILRAGNGILDGILELIPTARVGHIGLYRDHDTLMPVVYYKKLPNEMSLSSDILIVDPMLATGHSAIEAVNIVKRSAPNSKIKLVCLLAAPEGVRAMAEAHPDILIFTASLDERLNDKGYIVPGLGDAGDRIFGT
jgi:uracil phosphoribosyltransferase